MNKLYLLLLLAAIPVPANATFSLIQKPTAVCTACTTRTVNTTSTGSNHLLVLTAGAINGASGGLSVGTPPTGGCSTTWVVDASSSTGNSGTFGNISIAYCLSSSSGATTITATFSASNNYRVTLLEYSFTGASVSRDISAETSSGTSDTTHTGVLLTPITGTNDVIVRVAQEGVSNTFTVGSPYTTEVTLSGSNTAVATGDNLNTTSGTGPTWTQGSAGSFIEGAIAFSESGTAAIIMPPVVL